MSVHRKTMKSEMGEAKSRDQDNQPGVQEESSPNIICWPLSGKNQLKSNTTCFQLNLFTCDVSLLWQGLQIETNRIFKGKRLCH